MKIHVLFLAVAISAFSLKSMEQAEKTEQSHLLSLPQEMIGQILVKQLESCTSFDEQLKEIVRLRAVNTYFNKLFADFDSYFMKLVLKTLELNLTQNDKNRRFFRELNLNQKDKDRRFFRAASKNWGWLVKVMLKLGADVNVKDYIFGKPIWDNTALHGAALEGHTSLAQLLINHGANINEKEYHDYTPLQLAVDNGRLEIAQLLLDNGADVNWKDNDHHTPLHWAAFKGHTSLAQLLINHGANINEQNIYDATALHYAAFNGHLKIVKALLKHRAAVGKKNKNGRTALSYAIRKGHILSASLISVAIFAASISHTLANFCAPKAEAID